MLVFLLLTWLLIIRRQNNNNNHSFKFDFKCPTQQIDVYEFHQECHTWRYKCRLYSCVRLYPRGESFYVLELYYICTILHVCTIISYYTNTCVWYDVNLAIVLCSWENLFYDLFSWQISDDRDSQFTRGQGNTLVGGYCPKVFYDIPGRRSEVGEHVL
jgi:hypothetical protein